MKRYLDLMMKALLCAMFMCVFAACSDDEDAPDGIPGDPVGTVLVSMRNDTQDAATNVYPESEQPYSACWFYIDKADNFSGSNLDFDFVTLGKVNGLSNIKNIPESGWTDKVAVIERYGYVARYRYYSDDSYHYIRMYVVEYMTSSVGGGVIGAKVKYAPLEENGGGNGSSVNTKYLTGKWTFQKGIYNISGQKVTITKNQLKEYAAQAGVSIWDETLTFSGSKVNGIGYEVVGNKFRYTGGIYDEGYEDMTITIPTLTGSQLVLRYDLTKMIGMSYIADLYYSK